MNHVSQYIDEFTIVDPKDVNKEALASAGIDRKNLKDLMFVDFMLAHDGTNDNRDEFYTDELDKNYGTAKMKALDWEHEDQRIIGHIYNAERIKNNEKMRDGVLARSAIYKYRFPEEAAEIKSRHEKGMLRFSIETYFTKAKCSVCGEEYEDPRDYCEHLRNRMYSDGVSRGLLNINFAGAGVVVDPADKDSRSIALAKKNNDETNSEEKVNKVNKTDGKKTDEQKKGLKPMSEITETPEFKNAVKAAIDVELEKLRLNGEVSDAQEKLDKAEAQIETLQEKAKADAETAKAELDKIKAEKEKVEKDFEDFKLEVAKKEKLRERLTKLDELNLDIAEAELKDLAESFANMEDAEWEKHLALYAKMAEKAKANEEDTEEEEVEDEKEDEEEKADADAEDAEEGDTDDEELPVENDEEKADASKKFNLTDILDKLE